MSDVQKPLFASVLIDLRLDKALDYEVPEALLEKIAVGSRVQVPVRGKLLSATVVEIKQTASYPKLQMIESLLDEKVTVGKELFELCQWIAKYYACPLRKVLKVILPPSIRKNSKEKTLFFVKPSLTLEALKTLSIELRQSAPAQAGILDFFLKNPGGVFLQEAIKTIPCSKKALQAMEKKGCLEFFKKPQIQEMFEEFEYFITPKKSLNPEQKSAFETIRSGVQRSCFETYLLYGITGSGKTEVYLQAMQEALSLGKTVLFLVPEISLASQTLERIKSRFQEKVVTLHHKVAPRQRAQFWNQIRDGSARIVVGARSAIFAPVQKLGLIIVDEEHEGAYKQTEETPCYHGRDVAIMRAKLASCPVVLGSATPSIESFHNAHQGKYQLLRLSKRASDAELAKVHVVDMKVEFQKARGFTLFSERLLDGIKKRQECGEQTLLFLNRRGYHSQQMCSSCGHIFFCPHCSISLTYHLSDHELSCHLCGYTVSPPPRACPSCHSEEGLKFKGAGTEMVEKALHALFPQIRTLRLDADTTKKKGSHEGLFRSFKAGKADVLIGTQMIAKGLHFPSLTLAAVLYADAGLSIPDFRAAEHSFQMLVQVSGRAGRGQLPGEVILQTHLPDSFVIQCASKHDYEGFYQEEIKSRELFHYPPKSRLIKVLIYGKKEELVLRYAKDFRQSLIAKLPSSFEIEPVIPSGYKKIKDQFRFQFLIKTQNILLFEKALSEIDHQCLKPYGIERMIDVDPIHTYL